MSLSIKSILDFWYYLCNVKDGVDNTEFEIFYDLTRRMLLPSTASLERTFSLANTIKTNTNFLKPRLFRNFFIKTSIVM